jgi:serine/threonine protein kinase
LTLPFAKPSESRESRSRFQWRNAPKEPTQNIARKKQVRQEDVNFDYLLVNAKRALKVIGEKYLADESARLRFLREARAAASVRHPNVAPVFHLGRTGQNYFYAMEFVEGETIQNLIKRSRRLDVKLALEVTTQVAAGLAAVHEQNLVHRDIKPTNIMVRLKEGGAVTAKIIDLGLAKGVNEAWEKGERLAKLIAHRRTLLVLDGLEPLQNPPGPQEGRLREPSLQALLRELAAFNTGLCVITTRTPVADIADHEGSSALSRNLEQLSSDAGAKLLGALRNLGFLFSLHTRKPTNVFQT